MSMRAPWTSGAAIAAGQIVQPSAFVAPDKFDYVAKGAGTTGAYEPNWPTTAGGTVLDNGITWTCVEVPVMTWFAQAIYKTGATEPTWPTTPGQTTSEANSESITWTTKVQNVEDVNCPNSPVVMIAGNKVYAKGYGQNSPGDVVGYSATNRPLDWTTANDAGFLATGLNMQGSRVITAMGEYRSRGVFYSATTALIYDLDPDPAKIALFDNFEGLGCQWPRAACAVADDLYFPTAQGVRTLTYAANFDSLSAGDATSVIDPLLIKRLAAHLDALGFYYPNAGQYWLVFNEADGTATAFVYSVATAAKAGGWSRYTYPWPIDAYALNGSVLAFRSGDDVYEVSDDATDDAGVPIPGLVEWPYLDFGNLGVTKNLQGLDYVGSGAPSVSIGWDQTDPTAFTDPYPIPADTLPGQVIPMSIGAPSMSIRITWPAGPWSLQAVTAYLQDLRTTA